MEQESRYIYSQPVLDFVTVCARYCKQLEECREMERADFIRLMRGLLPMLYLRASLLKKQEETENFWGEDRVTEEDYNYIRASVSTVMGERDDYLDVFVEDFKYSDQPVLRTVSEDLADLYQVLRDFLEPYRTGDEESMEMAVGEVADSFGRQWGQTALNALRALHDAEFGGGDESI